MSLPPHQAIDVLTQCIAEVTEPALLQQYQNNKAQIINAVSAYDSASQSATWCTLPKARHGHPNDIISGTITKLQLTELYSTYMVKSSGPARKAYDQMMLRAHGKCPFCGGIGVVFTLDHYLPKSRYPLYSVLPTNLVPCCRDCNSGKSSTFGTVPGDQPIHPFMDATRFFSQRWVTAHIEKADPISATFHCSPPAEWSDIDKARVLSHFEDYRLAYRFGVVAGSELAKVVDARKGSLNMLSVDEYRAHLLESASSSGYDLNGWYRAMYAALAQTDWFLNADLNDPVTYL